MCGTSTGGILALGTCVATCVVLTGVAEVLVVRRARGVAVVVVTVFVVSRSRWPIAIARERC